MISQIIILFLLIVPIFCIIPPKFQWKTIDYAWKDEDRDNALKSGLYIPENNLPTGLARWKNKLFVTVPRWKKGIHSEDCNSSISGPYSDIESNDDQWTVSRRLDCQTRPHRFKFKPMIITVKDNAYLCVPSTLNYIYVNGTQSQLLNPYPNWDEGCVSDNACCVKSNSCVVSTFRVHVDKCDRLWVVDNGVADMANEVTQLVPPAILIFDLNTDTLINRYEFTDEVLRDSSVLTSVVVDIIGKSCENSYAYITDMGSNAIIVYHLPTNEAWRVENHYFHFDPHAGVYKVGGVDFYWSDGISSAALSHTMSDGHRHLFFHPTSSTKQFMMSTRLLRDKNIQKEEIFNGVEVVGERGPMSQATACDYDPHSRALFYTQLCKNGIGCWNIEKPFNKENAQVILSDCNMLEFPADIKVDYEGNLWILSNRQSRFLYETMDFSQINFRVLTAPVSTMLQGSPCEKLTTMEKAISFITRSKSSNTIFI